MLDVKAYFKFLDFSSGDERSMVVKLNIIYSVIIKGFNIIISFLLVPLTINYVSSELYGIWLSLSSIVGWLGYFDIGFGHGFRNKLTESLAYNKIRYSKILVSSTYALMSLIFLSLCIVTSIVCRFVNWSYLLNIPEAYNSIVTKAFQIVVIAFCARMILQLITNVCQAYQKTALASFIDLMGNFFGLIFIFLLAQTVTPNLVYLSIAMCGAPLLALIIATVILFSNSFREVAPNIKYARRFVIGSIGNLGFKFFLIQIACLILYQATNFIISHFCGPEQVTVYNIAYKYMNIAIMVFAIIQSPIWSAFSNAYALKDYGWMNRIYIKLLLIVLFTELSICVLVLISPIVYKLWINDAVYVPVHITILIAIYTGILLINNMNAMIINGIGKIKLQTITAWAQGLVYVPLVYLLAPKLQIEGILLSLIIVTIIPTYFLARQVYLQINQKAIGIYDT